MSEVAQRVKSIIVDKLGEESEVTETASFTNDLGVDSLDTVELIMEFEKSSTSPSRMIRQKRSLLWEMLLPT